MSILPDFEVRSPSPLSETGASTDLSDVEGPLDEVSDAVLVRRGQERYQQVIRQGPGGSRQGRDKPVKEFDPDQYDYTDEDMNELDDNGWAHIHHAAFRGFVKSVERFAKASEEQLELETGDDLHSTPLLLSVMSGNLETVQCIVNLGAKVWATNTQNHGAVELCAFKQFISLLEYFIELNHDRLPVWKNLIKFLASESDEEAEAAAKCLRTLTQDSSEGVNPNWKPAYDNGIVPTIAKVVKSTSTADQAKIPTFECLHNIVSKEEVKEQFSSAGGIPAVIRLLKSNNNFLVQLAAKTIKEMATMSTYADVCAQNGAIPALVKVVEAVREPDVLVEAVDALANISRGNETHQSAIGREQGAIQSIVQHFEDCTSRPLLMALTGAVSSLASMHEANQNAFIQDGAAANVITLIRVKNQDLQMNAVEAIHRLAENNPNSQKAILEDGVVMPLMQLLKRSRQPEIQRKTAGALWALAGDDVEERRTMAGMMGVQLLIEFLSSMSEELHFIGSEAVSVLSQGPLNKQDQIAQANGVHPLVRLLRSDKEYIVLSVIRTLRCLSVGVGYVPHARNQAALAQSRGLKFLVALMVHSRNEIIQVEAAHTLGCAALGNADNLEEIQQNLDFSYVRILKMMYAKDPLVRLIAGSALAAFSYNNLQNQKEVAEQGGVRFSCFLSFLKSDDEFFRCNAAFQVVVLARIIPDEEQAISSAAGIKLLADLLQDSKSDLIKSLTADCIARLGHTRAGVPAAFVSIDTVNYLCDLLLSPAEQVRGCAAIALGYLSFNQHALRQLLSRVDPYLMKILTYYTAKGKLSNEFHEGWKHYKQIGLPQIEEGRTCLVGKKNVQYNDKLGRPLTITSLDETAGNGTNVQSPSTNMQSMAMQDEEKSNLTSRSSRSSRGTIHSLTPRQANLSVNGSRQGSRLDLSNSRRSSILSNGLPQEVVVDN